jgi:hypothetical protein
VADGGAGVVGAGVAVIVWVGVELAVGVFEGWAVGASPSTLKTPDTFQINPLNIWTS